MKPRGGVSRGSKFIDLEGSIKVRSYVYLGTQEDSVANSGGFVGIMLQESFLGRSPVTLGRFVDHIEHVMKIGGEDLPALGSDYDGMITPPLSLPTPLAYPRIVDEMLKRKFSETAIRKFLGGNVLRVIEAVRG